MTSFVQPLDAGIIRCFKAHYRQEFCLHAIEKDEAGERDIYKINLLEGMHMAREAWKQVNASTIQHCWNHTKIQGSVRNKMLLDDSLRDSVSSEISDLESSLDASSPRADCGAWNILRTFAASDMTLPVAEETLKKHLGNRYNESDWQSALNAVMNAEGDVLKAQEALTTLAFESQLPRLTIRLPGRSRAPELEVAPQITEAEQGLMDSVEELVKRRRIIGPPPTLEDLVNPVEEREVGDSPYRFEGGDADIVAEVRREIAIQKGDIIELDADDDSDDDVGDVVSRGEVLKLCEMLEKSCLRYGNDSTEFSIDLPRQLRRYRAKLRQDDLRNSTQSLLENYFIRNAP